MKSPLVLTLIFSLLGSPLALFGAGGATVKVESAAVYVERSASAAVVKSLHKGDPVVVEIALAGEDGEWCSVREPDQKNTLGYMRCEDLEREPRPRPAIAAPPPPAPPETPPSPAVTGPARPAPRDLAARVGEDYMRLLRKWPNIFGFTAEQQAQVEDLANRMGVTACRRQIEDHHRNFARELTAPPLKPTAAEKQRMEEMKRAFNRFAYPCMMRMQETLEQLPALMTPEQQKANAQVLASFRKELAGMRKVLTSPDTYRGIY